MDLCHSFEVNIHTKTLAPMRQQVMEFETRFEPSTALQDMISVCSFGVPT